MRAMSTRNDEDHKGASRPFDKGNATICHGEGSGVLVMEELETSPKSEASERSIAEIVGYGNTADANHMTRPRPEGEGAVRCMRMAHAQRGIEPRVISYSKPRHLDDRRGPSRRRQSHQLFFGAGARKVRREFTKRRAPAHMMGAEGCHLNGGARLAKAIQTDNRGDRRSIIKCLILNATLTTLHQHRASNERQRYHPQFLRIGGHNVQQIGPKKIQ